MAYFDAAYSSVNKLPSQSEPYVIIFDLNVNDIVFSDMTSTAYNPLVVSKYVSFSTIYCIFLHV